MFVGEVVIVIGILAMTRFVADAVRTGPKPRLDVVGSVLAATGLGAVVLGILQSSTWGLIAPKDSPVTPFGLSLTPFVIAGGGRCSCGRSSGGSATVRPPGRTRSSTSTC